MMWATGVRNSVTVDIFNDADSFAHRMMISNRISIKNNNIGTNKQQNNNN